MATTNRHRPHGPCYLCLHYGHDCHCSQARVELADRIRDTLARQHEELTDLYRELATTK